jgi:hypothetical protein
MPQLRGNEPILGLNTCDTKWIQTKMMVVRLGT